MTSHRLKSSRSSALAPDTGIAGPYDHACKTPCSATILAASLSDQRSAQATDVLYFNADACKCATPYADSKACVGMINGMDGPSGLSEVSGGCQCFVMPSVLAVRTRSCSRWLASLGSTDRSQQRHWRLCGAYSAMIESWW